MPDSVPSTSPRQSAAAAGRASDPSAVGTAADDLLSSYDFELPPELIAQAPADRRDASRLLVYERANGAARHLVFHELPDLLSSGDLLVVNDTRVVRARLLGRRAQTGGRWEGLFLGVTPDGEWRLIGQTRGRLTPGERITIPAVRGGAAELLLELTGRGPHGEWRARSLVPGEPIALLDDFGHIPLPPYVAREDSELDAERYQTVYAERPGAVAAPTAGLHFTPELLARCAARGIGLARVTLHVGVGTFRPVSAERLAEHVMHAEWGAVPENAAAAVRDTRQRGGRVVAVGTTCVRTLETASAAGAIRAWSGETDLFIRPPFQFRSVDAMITNFHLPRSTLLMLVSAFIGRENLLAQYRDAVARRYRFFSYGDAMLLL